MATCIAYDAGLKLRPHDTLRRPHRCTNTVAAFLLRAPQRANKQAAPLAVRVVERPLSVLHCLQRQLLGLPGRRSSRIIAHASIDPRFQGVWQKDLSRSTPMDAVCTLVGLTGLVQQAIKLIRGCEIRLDSERFTLAVFSVLPLLKLYESYPLSGVEARNNRRDLRLGDCQGALSANDDATLALSLRWGQPYVGSGVDVFRLVGDNELHVTSTVMVNGQTASYTSVHTRQ